MSNRQVHIVNHSNCKGTPSHAHVQLRDAIANVRLLCCCSCSSFAPSCQRTTLPVIPPSCCRYARSKNAGTICWELLLDAVRSLRNSDRFKVTNFDGGPLNKAVQTCVHYQQFLVDAGIVDCALVQFYWRLKGKSEADGESPESC